MPKTSQKTVPEEGGVDIIEVEEDEEDRGAARSSTPGVVNPIEARHHVQHMEEALKDMKAKVETGEVKDVLKMVLQEFKDTITIVMPQMSEVDIIQILRSIKDPMSITLRLWTDEAKALLEEMMPTEDIPSCKTVAGMVRDIKEVTYNQKDMLVELFDNLEVMHN